MSLTYGFYNSIGSDRKYNAKQLSSIFDGIINDGVFISIGECLMVFSGSGMNINIGRGRAWFNHTWTDNDSVLPLTIQQSEVILNRIDIVALEVNSGDDVRANNIKVIKGTPSNNPVAPTLISTDLVHQYPLGHIYVAAGVTTITQGNITNKVGTTSCPFVTGVLETISTDTLITQWDSEFNTWFDNLKEVLTENAETNILNIIDDNKADNTKQIPHLGTTTNVGDIYSITTVETINPNEKFTIKFNTASTISPTLKLNNGASYAIRKPNGTSAKLYASVYTLFWDGSNFTLLGEGGEYGTATANDVRNTKTFGTDNGIIQGGLNLSNLIESNIRKDVIIDGKIGTCIGITAGDQILLNLLPTWDAPPLTTFAEPTPTKLLNGIQMNIDGVFRVKATVNSGYYNEEHHIYQFYKNGVAIGSVFDFPQMGGVGNTIAQDFTCVKNDIITLYGWYIQTTSGSGFKMQDFQICAGPPTDITYGTAI